MSEDEFGEFEREFSKFRRGFEYKDFSDELFDQLKHHRKLVKELNHRLIVIEYMLRDASCPTGCENSKCAWCWSRTIELNALKTYHKELGI